MVSFKNLIRYSKYFPHFHNQGGLKELTFFCTNRCNFKCPFCFNNQKSKDLSLEEIETISRRLPNFMRLLISGGEPFLRDDMIGLCGIFANNNDIIHLTIPTNGWYSERIGAFASIFCLKYPDVHVNISLSLDEIGKDRDKLVGMAGSFDKLRETYDLLRSFNRKNLSVGTITTQCKENQYHLKEIYYFAKDILKVDNFSFNRARGEELDMNIYRDFTRFLIKNNKSKLPLSWLYEKKCRMVYDAVLNEKYPNPCYAGKLKKVIGADGKEYPCETLMFGGSCPCLHECDLATNLFFDWKSWI